ncbi:unnamed protein product [Cunninghamella blakesleeana]
MKCLSLFIFTLWLVSIFVLADKPVEINKNNSTKAVEEQHLEADSYRMTCFWTNCYHNTWCPRGTFQKGNRRCGRHYTQNYCCRKEWNHGWDHGRDHGRHHH